MAVRIIETEKISMKGPTLVEGFPGLGLVGTIAATYLVDKLKMKQVGYIVSEKFPPIAAIHNNTPLHPARVYASTEHNLLVVLSEFIIPLNAVYDLSETLIDWAMKKKVSRIISLGGIVIQGEQDEVFGIASKEDLVQELGKQGVKMIKEGATTGVNGLLLADCATRGFPAISLLAEAKQNHMDPMGAAMVIEALKKIVRLDIDTKDLVKESKELEAKMKDLIEKASDASKHYKEVEEMGAMYR